MPNQQVYLSYAPILRVCAELLCIYFLSGAFESIKAKTISTPLFNKSICPKRFQEYLDWKNLDTFR